MITTASEHQVDKVEQMAGGKGHVIIEHLLGEKELDGKCGLYAKVTIERLPRAPRRDRDLLHPER